MEIKRKKFTTQLSEDILANLSAKSKRGSFGSVNKVIEALATNFLDYMDDEGNIKVEFFTRNGLPQPVIKALLRNFAMFLDENEQRDSAQTQAVISNSTDSSRDSSKEMSEASKREIEGQLDSFLNSFKI